MYTNTRAHTFPRKKKNIQHISIKAVRSAFILGSFFFFCFPLREPIKHVCAFMARTYAHPSVCRPSTELFQLRSVLYTCVLPHSSACLILPTYLRFSHCYPATCIILSFRSPILSHCYSSFPAGCMLFRSLLRLPVHRYCFGSRCC